MSNIKAANKALRKLDKQFLGGKHGFLAFIDDADAAVGPWIDDEAWDYDQTDGLSLAASKRKGKQCCKAAYAAARGRLNKLLTWLSDLDEVFDDAHTEALKAIDDFKPKAAKK